MEIILASNSPRRKELLEGQNIKFKVIPARKEEVILTNKSVYALTEILAENKAREVFEKHGGIVLGADTVVSYNGKIYGKPKDKNDAIQTLNLLSNKTHEVVTGFSILSKSFKYTSHEVTKVTFNNLSDELINNYVNTGSPLDKAGSYGIQDGFDLVKSIDGSLSNVIGLPVERIVKILKENFNG